MDGHGMREMAVRLVVRKAFGKGQRAILIQVQSGQLGTDSLPVLGLIRQLQFRSQLGSGIESEVHQGKIIVRHIFEPGVYRIIEDLRAGTQR